MKEYREHMIPIQMQVRQSVVLGHQLDVHLSDDDRWGVAVDGQELLTLSGEAYGAWAIGVAESYRQGKTAVSPNVND